MKRSYYTSETKVSDILQDNMRRVGMLELFGIGHGFDRNLSVLELCNAYGVNFELFLHIFNIYTFDDYLPEKIAGSRFPVDHAVAYVCKAHDFFIDICLAQMKEYCDAIVSCPVKEVGNVTVLFKALRNATEEHVLSYRKIYAQYKKSSKPVLPEQIEHIAGQELKITQITDALIKYLLELTLPDEYQVPLDQLKYFLIFTRADYDKQRKINDAIFKELLRD